MTVRKKAPAISNAAEDARSGKVTRVGKAAGNDAERRGRPRDGRLLDPVLAAMRKRVGKAGGDDASAFAAAFYERMGEDEIGVHEADGWAALAADFLAFLGKRKPGTASIRLFNPTLATHGWETQHTVLQIANDDMPLLVGSGAIALAELGVGVHVLGHPGVSLERDRGGKLQGVGEGTTESLMHMEIDRQSPEGCACVEAAVRGVLEDVRSIVADWATMRTRMELVAEGLSDG